AQGLQQFASGQNIDMLIVLPHKHSFFERLFAKENTDDILRTVTIPVLCLHE
ncbi:MAG: universal stress protein, partial [Chitinophagaceae bacterium]